MTPQELTDWRRRLSFTKTKAADILGCGRRSLDFWESGERQIPRYIELACAAVALGLGQRRNDDAHVE